MPEIRPSADLRNSYAEISDYCHSTGNPVYITRNGRSDLVVLSSEMYDHIFSSLQSYRIIENNVPTILTEEKLNTLIAKSIEDISQGRTVPLAAGMAEARRQLKDV